MTSECSNSFPRILSLGLFQHATRWILLFSLPLACVPNADGKTAKVFLSEQLKPSSEVAVSLIGRMKLNVHTSDEKELPLMLVKSDQAYTIDVPGNGGGFNDRGKIVREVAVYDSKTDQWGNGPVLPGDEMNGFPPAACVHDGMLYVSVQQWEHLGTSTPRLAHRIGFWNNSVLMAGGVAKGNNLNLIESIAVRGNQIP